MAPSKAMRPEGVSSVTDTNNELFLINPDYGLYGDNAALSKQSIAYSYLCSSIISGHMAPGTPIIEREVCERLGVSRTPVREALRRLSSEGLVDFITNRGAFVSSLSKEKVMQLYEVKEALEIMAALLCSRRASEKDFREMDKCIDAQQNCVITGKIPQSLDEDMRFHVLLAKSCGNTMLELQATSLMLQTRRLMSIYDLDRMDEFISQHRRIMECMRNKDEKEIIASVDKHINTVAHFQIAHWDDVQLTGQ